MTIKTYFVYDKDTSYILSCFDCCSDDHKDGFNIFNRPYELPEFHSKNEKCRLDYIYFLSKRSGLASLKKENLKVGSVNYPHDIKCHFIENPEYSLSNRNAIRGWWKIDDLSDIVNV